MYIFPGLGLAASIAGLERITDSMLYAAAVATADSLNEQEIAEGRTFPNVNRIRDVSHAVACAVIKQGLKEDMCDKIIPRHLEEGIESVVTRKMYYPEYVPII